MGKRELLDVMLDKEWNEQLSDIVGKNILGCTFGEFQDAVYGEYGRINPRYVDEVNNTRYLWD